MEDNLKPNEQHEAKMMASDRDMASNLPISGEDNFPEVFATSRMIALMEMAAARLMKRLLKDGQLSVGVGVNITHTAATPNQQEVWAVATFLHMEGKLYRFNVEAFDHAGKIGEGEHTRAIVSEERLLTGAVKRFEKAGKETH